MIRPVNSSFFFFFFLPEKLLKEKGNASIRSLKQSKKEYQHAWRITKKQLFRESSNSPGKLPINPTKIYQRSSDPPSKLAIVLNVKINKYPKRRALYQLNKCKQHKQ